MSTRSSHGNLTAALVVVALLELVVDRLIGRLFLSPGCHSVLGCLALRAGPFLLYLTGALAVMVTAGGIAGHLGRGELFPRGVRLTLAALSLVFLLLMALSLAFGQLPEPYRTYLQTSFGFVAVLLTLSLIGPGSGALAARARVGFLLFALPPVLHVLAALASSRAGWLRHGWMSPERLTTWGEATLLFAAATSPLSLLPGGAPRARVGAGVALAAGISAFFFVALLGRYDLVQTMVLYGLHLELPRAWSPVGAVYVLALFGFLTTLGVLLMSGGAPRLIGLGMALIAIAGYQTSSPISLALSLCGLLALATGTLRSASGYRVEPLPWSPASWGESLGALAAAIADPPTAGTAPVLIEMAGGDAPALATATVRISRHGRSVAIEIGHARGLVRDLRVTVGAPGDAEPDATIETHEAWLSRRPEDRTTLPRAKTGDPAFDRKMGVYGHVRIEEPSLRRRILRLGDGTITLWGGSAARFVAPTHAPPGAHRFTHLPGPAGARHLVELVDTLSELIKAGEGPAPPATEIAE